MTIKLGDITIGGGTSGGVTITGGSIIGGSFSGLGIGGNNFTSSSAKLPYETSVGGVKVKFNDPQGGYRTVSIGGGVTVTVGNGNSTSMQVDGLNIRSSGNDLFVNGVKVDFAAATDPKVASAARAEAQRAAVALKARYPGVNFIGEPNPDRIESTVKIAPGATIHCTDSTELRGATVIGASAVIRDSVIDGSRADGEVVDSVINPGSCIEAGARVTDSVVNCGQIKRGAEVTDSVINGAIIYAGEKVRDAVR